MQPPSRALKWIIIIAIAIVLSLFFTYAISLAYPAPQYDKYCPTTQIVNPPTTQQQCLNGGGQWTQTVSPQPSKIGSTAPQTQGYCDINFTCQKKFSSAESEYNRTVFIVLVILGILSLLAGVLYKASDVVSVGLSLGGILSLIVASVRYWSDANNLIKVLILAAALLALLWLGVKKFKNY